MNDMKKLEVLDQVASWSMEDWGQVKVAMPNTFRRIGENMGLPFDLLQQLSHANKEWMDKTQFIQDRINDGQIGSGYLGMHRADIMRALIEAGEGQAVSIGSDQPIVIKVDELGKPTDEKPGRSAKKIVIQTEKLARYLLGEVYKTEFVGKGPMRDASNPKAGHCWLMACEAQMMLTNTDPMDAVSELEEDGDE